MIPLTDVTITTIRHPVPHNLLKFRMIITHIPTGQQVSDFGLVQKHLQDHLLHKLEQKLHESS